VAGVYDPQSRRVRWFTQPGGAIVTVRNPDDGRTHVERNAQGGIAGVFDPLSRQPFFERGARHEGVALVVDGRAAEVESYRTARRPIVGYIHPKTQRPEFDASNLDGMAVVYRDGASCRSACSDLPR
jgi:hypothetical protein